MSDNGLGIPEEILDRIFDPFFTTKGAGKGTGLGLFLSYGIMLEHHGRLEAKNGKVGAVFSVQLPELPTVREAQQEAIWESRARY